MTKLTIDLKNGLLEVEGEEEFVRGIYADYKDVLSMMIARQSGEGRAEIPAAASTGAAEVSTGSKNKKADRAPKQTRSKSMESYKMLGNLDLNPQGKTSLRAFMASKNPADAGEINTVIVHYLKKTLNTEHVTLDHIYTCYKSTDKKVPTALLQSLKDAMRRKGWVDSSNIADIKLTTAGENLVEYELPRKEKSSTE